MSLGAKRNVGPDVDGDSTTNKGQSIERVSSGAAGKGKIPAGVLADTARPKNVAQARMKYYRVKLGIEINEDSMDLLADEEGVEDEVEPYRGFARFWEGLGLKG
jgi:hypothetical protein